jgi:hypothetical protein
MAVESYAMIIIVGVFLFIFAAGIYSSWNVKRLYAKKEFTKRFWINLALFVLTSAFFLWVWYNFPKYW